MTNKGIDQLNELIQKTLPKGRVKPVNLKLCPDIRLFLYDPDTLLGPLSHDEAQAVVAEPAYWSFCWASGQALASYIMRNQWLVEGKVIADFGAGSGIVAIACMMAGAKHAYAIDIDPDALLACQVNAQLNQVKVETLNELDALPRQVDLLLASDVLYDRENLPMLDEFAAYCQNIVLADSRLKLMPNPQYKKIEQIEACTWPDLNEFEEFNQVRIYLKNAT